VRPLSETGGGTRAGRRPAPRLRLCAILAMTLVLGACAALTQKLEPPRVSLAGIEPEEFSLFEQRYLLRLRIQNPNEVELPIEGMAFRLYLNDEEFASGVSDRRVTVPAFGEQLVEARVTSSLAGVIEQLRRMSRTETQTFSYRLAGHVKLLHRATKYRFDYHGEIDLGKIQD
jgi:LEA14-like dessication related protein